VGRGVGTEQLRVGVKVFGELGLDVLKVVGGLGGWGEEVARVRWYWGKGERVRGGGVGLCWGGSGVAAWSFVVGCCMGRRVGGGGGWGVAWRLW